MKSHEAKHYKMQKSFQSTIQIKLKKSLAFKIQRILQEKTKFSDFRKRT